MYQLLFIIHGMGTGARPTHDPHWWTEIVDDLRRAAKTYRHDADLVLSAPKAGQVLVVPLTYHQVFDEIRSRWAARAPSESGWLPLLRQLAFTDPAASTKLPGWVTRAGSFFWTHVLDVLLYRYVADFTIPIRELVATQIADAWHRADLDNGTNTSVHFLAHSLGTAVLHDSISFLGNDPGFGPTTHLISTVISCANVSAVLENGFPAYDSLDRPINAPPPPDGLTAAHFSFRHELDPIVEVVKTFRGDLHGWPADSYRDEVAIDVKDWNVHGYTQYLDNPITHLRLFERLWPNESWESRRDAAIAAYKDAPGNPCPAALATARQDLEAVFAQPCPQTTDGFVDVVVETLRVFDKARTACRQEGGR
jgi:hypothetical protein